MKTLKDILNNQSVREFKKAHDEAIKNNRLFSALSHDLAEGRKDVEAFEQCFGKYQFESKSS